jgi:preprotein translocase subunit YajC
VVTLEIADKVRVKVQRGYIAALLSRGENKADNGE